MNGFEFHSFRDFPLSLVKLDIYVAPPNHPFHNGMSSLQFTTPNATILLSNGKWNEKLNTYVYCIGITQAKDMEQWGRIFSEEVSILSSTSNLLSFLSFGIFKSYLKHILGFKFSVQEQN